MIVLLGAAALLVAGCGGSGDHPTATHAATTAAAKSSAPNALPASVPHPNFARFLPANYRARRVWYALLSNATIPDAVISSVGPPVGPLSFHSADLQVLSFDPIAKRWIDAFDAQKITPANSYFSDPTDSNAAIYAPLAAGSAPTPTTTAPLLDPQTDVQIGQVVFIRFAPGQGDDLVFTASTSYGGSGVGSQLNVVSFKNQEASIVYSWSGEGLYPFRTAGSPQRQRLLERAEFWTIEDPHCCPARTYRFTVAAAGSGATTYISDIKDERPWLGVYVQSLNQQDSASPLQVLGVVPDSPAAQVGFRRGDVILSIPGAPKLKNPPSLGPALVDEFSLFNAGDDLSFVVRRGSQTLTLNARLGSMIDSSALGAFPGAGSYTVATI